MVNLNYKRGAARERYLVNRARAEGKEATRNAGSHGYWDILILDEKEKTIQLIQVKTGVFTEKEKQALMDEHGHFSGIYKVTFEINSAD